MPPGPPSAISRSRERCSLLAESSPFAALQEPPGPLQPPGSLPLARADADADCRALESTKNRSSAPGHCRNAYRSVQTAATSSHAATCARSAFAEQPSRARAMNAPPPACAWVLPSGAGPLECRPPQSTARRARRPPRPACDACPFDRPRARARSCAPAAPRGIGVQNDPRPGRGRPQRDDFPRRAWQESRPPLKRRPRSRFQAPALLVRMPVEGREVASAPSAEDCTASPAQLARQLGRPGGRQPAGPQRLGNLAHPFLYSVLRN